MLAVEPMGDQAGLPVCRLVTMAQSPAAYTSGTLVRSCRSVRMVPLNISIPLPSRKAVLGRMPMASTRASAFMARLLVSTFSTLPLPSAPSRDTPVIGMTPASAILFSTYSLSSGSRKLGRTWGAKSITVVLTPLTARFSATSRPMKPPPATTARLISPASTAARRAMASSGVRMTNTFFRSSPWADGMKGDAPVAITSLS